MMLMNDPFVFFLCFGLILSYLISLDVLLRYPVTPDFSSRSRPTLQYVAGIHFMYPDSFFIILHIDCR